MLDKLKQFKELIAVIAFFGAIVTGVLAYAEQQKKVEGLEKIAAQQADIQTQQQEFQDKIMEFTMQLWQIEPETRKKWREFPKSPSVVEIIAGADTTYDTVIGSEWIVFEETTRLLKFKIEKDSLGYHLLVDTLFEYKPEKK